MNRIGNLKNKRGFTILELLISMTLFALIITSVLVAVENLAIARLKTLNRVALLEELYFFSEQLFTSIKDGGTLDYEEYWNRQAVGTSTQSGHYTWPTGVGNYGHNGSLGSTSYGSGLYLCRSNNDVALSMGTGGCLSNHNNAANGNLANSTFFDFSGSSQRYGQYLAQFNDYNSNHDNDYGDENNDASGSIIGDDDDRSIGDVPGVSTGAMQELYLINKNAKKRIFFRWNIQQDPNNIAIPCSWTVTSGKINTNSGCIGNVQVLKLKGLDVGLSHSGYSASNPDLTSYDGIIDTWVCNETGQCGGPLLPSPSTDRIATGESSEWLDLFPGTINVKNLTFQIYPIKDPWLSWAAQDCDPMNTTCVSPFIHPYVRMNLEMGFSWGKRRTLKNEDPTISISTSISLSDFE
ncbi:prepilin-type N-terminal cleavage/methylation domain-containing protein [Candidatus Gracilibacteria bacterium]|nr:prepilin-type N-terminal cleavage/methylation domain-containing protein [Candidatus Gracilibacteria bacterium]